MLSGLSAFSQVLLLVSMCLSTEHSFSAFTLLDSMRSFNISSFSLLFSCFYDFAILLIVCFSDHSSCVLDGLFFPSSNGNIACLVRKISVYLPCTSGQSGKEDRKVRKSVLCQSSWTTYFCGFVTSFLWMTPILYLLCFILVAGRFL